jgi:uncharacterized protein YndB with AHSA1/START domain
MSAALWRAMSGLPLVEVFGPRRGPEREASFPGGSSPPCDEAGEADCLEPRRETRSPNVGSSVMTANASMPWQLEVTAMPNTSFVYTTYINTTPKQLWQAMIDPAFTRRYWGATFESDWQVGSTYRWQQNGATVADPDQIVLESDPYRRLSYTWHTFTPEWAEATGFGDDYRMKAASEPRSKVTFELEPAGETVKLTVVHDGFEPGSTVLEGVREGWPRILSELKTLLETGETLAASERT